jgi:hypothetical protein
MKLAVMQPYFFPYIGYWQLISAVDTFVIYDDVNYIKQGWINRNNIIGSNFNQLISLQVIGASSFKLINEIEVGNNSQKILKTIEQTYKKAPYFESVFPLLQVIMQCEEKNLAKFLNFLIKEVCAYIEIKTTISTSSELVKNNKLKGQDKILDLCKVLKAKQYINVIGGRELYQKEMFSRENIELSFMKSKLLEYSQFREPFSANLSIIDVLMFNNKEKVRQYLTGYELV